MTMENLTRMLFAILGGNAVRHDAGLRAVLIEIGGLMLAAAVCLLAIFWLVRFARFAWRS